MVLEDMDSSPDSFSENPYPSEDDAYASSPSGYGSFDDSDLTKPIPILGPLFGFSDRGIRLRTESTMRFAERRVKRQLTYDEAHALAGHLYKLEAKRSYFTAVGAAFGSWRWYQTFSTGRFPFHQPKNVDLNKFLFIRGPGAFYARHSTRLLLYIFAASEFGNFFGLMIGQPVVARDTAKDPRLERLVADLKGVVDRDKAEGLGGIKEQLNQQGKAAREAAKAASGGQVLRRPMSVPEKPPYSGDVDDMSPTAGNEPWPSSSGSSWGDSSFASDPESSQQQSAPARQQQSHQPLQSWTSRKPSPQADADDASPTGGLFSEEVQSQSRPGESAWERLRRGGGPPGGLQRPPPRGMPSRTGTSPQREQHEDSTLGDSFTFAESDEERKRAQERAQREFDERIERERQGKDFDEGGKRW